GSYIGYGVKFRPKCVKIGKRSFIGDECWIASRAIIGDYVMVAARVSIVGGDHTINKIGVPMIDSGRAENKTVIIEDDAWIGHGAKIMHGVTIGRGSIVAVGSVITRNVNPYEIVGGNPARLIRMRFSDEEIIHHEARKVGWE
ncbi:MAG: DapH/DapD/GlmU-related protein, partial [Desulfatitalea sp.]